jgi:hypothetical protein
VLRIIRVKAELLVEFADRRLLRRLARFHLAARKGELAAVRSALCALDQEHLTVERVHLNALATAVYAASSECHWWNQECGDCRYARRSLDGGIQVNRLKARESTWGEVWLQREGEWRERSGCVTRKRTTQPFSDSLSRLLLPLHGEPLLAWANGDPWRTRRTE